MVKGVLSAMALAVISDGDTYGYQVLNDLRSRGLDRVGDASVYGTLQKLYETGLVSCYVVASTNGPRRKYYSITAEGSAALKSDRDEWVHFRSVVSDVLDLADQAMT